MTVRVLLTLRRASESESDGPPAPVARAQQSGGFRYSSNGTAITITGYAGTNNAITIPGTIAGLPVRAIGDVAFYGYTRLTSVSIADSITRIGQTVTVTAGDGLPGWIYELQRTGNLDVTLWVTVGTVPPLAVAGPVELTDATASTPQAFYRVVGHAP